MKIFKLLEMHRQFQMESELLLNLGDAFLLKHNSFYAAVRKGAVDAGFTYTTQFDANYYALSLSRLDAILEAQKIPYFDNVSVLKEVEKKIPQTTNWDEISDNLKRNSVFHESCHANSRTLANLLFKKKLTSQETILKLLIEESFSNACELFGMIEVDQPAHRLFYEANSFIYVYEQRVHLIELARELGPEITLQFMILSYLHSNFLRTQLEDKSFLRILKILRLQKLEPTTQKKLRALSRIAFELNPRFREITSGFYLRLTGHKITADELRRFEFLSLIEADPHFEEFLRRLSKLFLS